MQSHPPEPYRPNPPNDRPRSLSIQSLISSPRDLSPEPEPEHANNSHGANGTSTATTTTTTTANTMMVAEGHQVQGVKRHLESYDEDGDMDRTMVEEEDWNVRMAAEALGDLRAGG